MFDSDISLSMGKICLLKLKLGMKANNPAQLAELVKVDRTIKANKTQI